jgi:NTE family protein
VSAAAPAAAPAARPAAARPRRGIVLGAGGVLGAAWSVGALCAIEEVAGLDPRSAEVLLGTSAGSVLAALLAAGIPAPALRDHQRGVPVPGGVTIDWDHDRDTGGALPVRPRLAPGSPDLLRHGALHPRRVRPLVTLAGLLPRGVGSLEPLARAVSSVFPGPEWPRDGLGIVALDYRTGRRVVFGWPGAPPATLAEAVTASCAIPGWYAPVVIGGRDYVDGGPMSSTSADLLAGQPLEEVYVLAPTASFRFDRPAAVPARLERRWRRRVAANLLREARQVEAGGTRVVLLTPGPEDLAAIGSNLMDATRRLHVLETSLRTSGAVLRRKRADEPAAGF